MAGEAHAGRWGRGEELQGATIFLASAASDFVNGQILYVDGGAQALHRGARKSVLDLTQSFGDAG